MVDLEATPDLAVDLCLAAQDRLMRDAEGITETETCGPARKS